MKKEWINNHVDYWRNVFLGKFFPRRLADILYVKYMGGGKIDWKHPKDLNEKINWLKFNSDTSVWTRLADKYLVREFVKERGFKEILVPLLGVWNKADEIDWSSLPNQFVVKTNNGAGSVLIVEDKSNLNIDEANRKLKSWLKKRFGLVSAEPHYLKILPKIIAEGLLHNDASFSDSLVDYKVWCFNGKVFGTWCCFNRKAFVADTEWHDLNWNFRPEWSVFTEHYKNGGGVVPKPKCYEELLRIATSLSVGFPEVRVDLYIVNDKVYFGEMTFTSASGHNNFYSKEALDRMGDMTII